MKKQSQPIKTKLKQKPGEIPHPTPTDQKKKTIFPKSFKLSAADVENLNIITKELKRIYPTFKEVHAIKALLLIGAKMNNKDRIIKAYKESL